MLQSTDQESGIHQQKKSMAEHFAGCMSPSDLVSRNSMFFFCSKLVKIVARLSASTWFSSQSALIPWLRFTPSLDGRTRCLSRSGV